MGSFASQFQDAGLSFFFPTMIGDSGCRRCSFLLHLIYMERILILIYRDGVKKSCTYCTLTPLVLSDLHQSADRWVT